MIQKTLITIGIFFCSCWFVIPTFRDIGLGRLLGDFLLKKKNRIFTFPLLHALLSALFLV